MHGPGPGHWSNACGFGPAIKNLDTGGISDIGRTNTTRLKAVLPLLAQLVTVGVAAPLCYWLFRHSFGWGLHLSAALTAAIAMLAGLIAALVCWKRGQRKG